MGAWKDYWCLFIFCLVISFLSCKSAGIDNTVCTQEKVASPSTFPTMPNLMELRVQSVFNLNGEDKLYNIIENIDNDKRRLSIKMNKDNYEDWYLFFSETNEKIRLATQGFGTENQYPQVCSVTKFAWNLENFIEESLNPDMHEMMYSIILLYAKDNATEDETPPTESPIINGIKVKKWTACLFYPKQDVTTSVTYYFTDPKVSTPFNQGNSTPVQIIIKGTKNHDQHFTVTLNYMNVRYNFVQRYQFQLPPGTYCANRTVPEYVKDPFFRESKYFKTNVEIVKNMKGFEGVDYVKWWDDRENKISRMDCRLTSPFTFPGSTQRYLPLQSNIFDENLGKRFIIYDNFQCKVVNIKEFSDDVSLKYIYSYYEELYDVFRNTSKPYQFQDQKNDRGIDCVSFTVEDTYLNVTENNELELIDDIEELLISSVNVAINTGRSAESGAPLRYNIYDRMKEIHFTYVFYDFDDEVESTYGFDISPCFKPTNMKNFVFYLNTDDNTNKKIKIDIRETSYSIHKYLYKAAKVSPLKINNVRLQFEGSSNPKVTFSLLGQVDSTDKDPNLNEAAKNLQANFKGDVIVPDPENIATNFTIKYKASSGIKEVTQSTGYSPGDMAGLAIGMIIMGCLLAVFIIFIFNKYDIAGFKDGLGAQLSSR